MGREREERMLSGEQMGKQNAWSLKGKLSRSPLLPKCLGFTGNSGGLCHSSHSPWSQLWYGHCRFGKACGPGGDPINGDRDSWSPTPFFPLKSKEGAQSAPICPGGQGKYSGSTRSWKAWFRGFGLHSPCGLGACLLKCIS